MIRSSTATWKGPGFNGEGRLTTSSSVLYDVPYNFNSRFGETTMGTNPEELLAAAHASCFTMKLSFVLGEAGFVAAFLQTTANINFENGSIVGSKLILSANIPGISQEVFDESVADAARNCPISRILNTKITIDASVEF